VSVGVATLVPERGRTVELLVAAAERALGHAKVAGRNRVQTATGGKEISAERRRGPDAAANGSPG